MTSTDGLHRSWLLIAGFGVALALRLVIGGHGVSQSPTAGIAFGGVLLVLALAGRVQLRVRRQDVVVGVLGAVVLCLPVLLSRGSRPLHGGAGFGSWAAAVTLVAVCEELFLRGALYSALSVAKGPGTAISVGALAFALLHVPLYGWHVVPLDLLVGVFLGELRRRAGTPSAPAITHAGADLAAWFLR